MIRFECPGGGGRHLLKDDPMRMRPVPAWRKKRLTWDQAENVYRAAMTSIPFRTWWEHRRGSRSGVGWRTSSG
ncbi:hypothetical protein [Amycolatopsis coloradensis]|nr:hypothetical protein [Amycolatopsis coloradensis]